jgi:hypothetical protein
MVYNVVGSTGEYEFWVDDGSSSTHMHRHL